VPIYTFEDKQPAISDSAYIAPTAVIVGDVAIGELCFIGHGAILRGDYCRISIGDSSAVEEGAIILARRYPDGLKEVSRDEAGSGAQASQ